MYCFVFAVELHCYDIQNKICSKRGGEPKGGGHASAIYKVNPVNKTQKQNFWLEEKMHEIEESMSSHMCGVWAKQFSSIVKGNTN